MALPYVHDLGGGVHLVDTGFHRPAFDAAYLIVEGGRAAFVDTGTNHSVPRLLAALGDLGLAPESVDHVIPTHVHLDHAGGVGLLMQSLPRATVLAHPRAVRHLVDPTALYQGALAVYGEAEMARNYGTLQPVPAGRVVAVEDGAVVALAGRPLRFIDTPGHARHHQCIWDEHTRAWFTGDTFGLGYPEFHSAQGDWVLPTTTPVQFEPEALHRSIDRLLEARPEAMYLTHYGRVRDVARLGALLHEQIDAMVALARGCQAAPDRHQVLKRGLQALLRTRLQAHGVDDLDGCIDGLALDIELNAQGLGIWLDRAPA